MTRSMTGFGSARAEREERIYAVEIRSVNHRFCEVRFHMPSDLQAVALELEPRIRKRVARGRVDLTVSIGFVADATALPRIDLPRARGYLAAYGALATALGYETVPSLETIATSPGVLRAPEVTLDEPGVKDAVREVIDRAIDDLCAMRDREGATLAISLRSHLEKIVELAAQIERDAPRAIAERRAKMTAKIAEMLGAIDLDRGRLEQEIAILADRTDVTEEITRLRSHAAQVERLLASDEPVGRKLDFLCQELGREANTVGAKCSDARMSHAVVELKAELERMREQVQNIE